MNREIGSRGGELSRSTPPESRFPLRIGPEREFCPNQNYFLRTGGGSLDNLDSGAKD